MQLSQRLINSEGLLVASLDLISKIETLIDSSDFALPDSSKEEIGRQHSEVEGTQKRHFQNIKFLLSMLPKKTNGLQRGDIERDFNSLLDRLSAKRKR